MFKKLLLILALAVGTCFAQNGAFAPYVDGSISAQAQNALSITNVSNPSYRIGGGVESSTSHWLLDVNGQFDSANFSGFSGLIHKTGGYTGTVTGSAYYKFHGFLLGGGGYWSNQVASCGSCGPFSGFNYKQIRPFIGGGFQFPRDRVIGTYVLPGVDEINGGGLSNVFTGIHSQIFNVDNEIFLGKTGIKKHLRLTQHVAISSADTNALGLFTNAVRSDGINAGAGLKVVF